MGAFTRISSKHDWSRQTRKTIMDSLKGDLRATVVPRGFAAGFLSEQPISVRTDGTDEYNDDDNDITFWESDDDDDDDDDDDNDDDDDDEYDDDADAMTFAKSYIRSQ